jgi:hypothetical protein
MGDLAKGHSWATGDLITAANFNSTVDDGTVTTNLVTSRGELINPVDFDTANDQLLIHDASAAAFKRCKLANLPGITTANPPFGSALTGTTPTYTCVATKAVQQAIIQLPNSPSNATLTINNVADGMQGLFIVIQDPTGGRVLTLPSGSLIPGSGSIGTGPADLITTASRSTVCTWVYAGTNYWWAFAKY